MDDVFILRRMFYKAIMLDPIAKARMIASIYYKGKVISTCRNSLKTHPFQKKYSEFPYKIHMHAEIGAIKNALKVISVDQLTDCTLYICRAKRISDNDPNSMFGLSKPCLGCFKAISEFQIGRVVYTLDDQDNTRFEELR